MSTFRRCLMGASLVAVALLGLLLLAGMGGKPVAEKKVAEKETERPANGTAATLPAGSGVQPSGNAGSAAGKERNGDWSGGDPVYVRTVNIADREVLQGKKPIIVTFSAPMAAPDALNVPVAEADRPFVLQPPVSGEGRWLTASSFAMTPEGKFRPGLRYFLRFKDGLKALDGRPASYLLSFRTENVQLSALRAEHFDSGKNTLVLYFAFSRAVTGKALAGHLTIRDAASGEILPSAIRDGDGQDSDQRVLVTLGKYRPRLEVALRPDEDSDRDYLGLAAPYAGSVTLADPEGSGATRIEAPSGTPSKVKFQHSYTSENFEGHPYAHFDLSESLQGGNYKEFIKVEPEGLNCVLSEYGDVLRINDGLVPGMRVTVSLKPGLVDAAGRVLAEERSSSLTIKDHRPAARFAHHGHYLSPVYGTRLGVNLVNVDHVTVSLKRQYDNNLPFMNLEPDYRAREIMRSLGFREIPIKGGKKNEVLRRALDVNDLAKGRRGAFLVTLQAFREVRRADGGVYMDQESSSDQLVVLTDIGITARVFPSGITVLAAGLSSANPLAGADVRVYSASNQLIARGQTGPDGRFVHQRAQEWDPQLTPSVVTVQHGQGEESDLSFLPLENATRREMADAARRDYLDKGYEAFVYTPRGVFRPGERVDLKTFVRDAAQLPPSPFPVLFRVLSARGLEAARGAAVLSAEGGADFSFVLPPTAPTGEYRAQVEIPGQKGAALGSCAFSVEEFVPPRLEVTLSPKTERLSASETTLPVGLSGRYLFGAPGAGLKYELGYRATAGPFSPEGWEGYVFGDGERVFDPQTELRHLSGELNGDGLAEVMFKPPAGWTPPALLKVLLVANVREDSGRWVTRTKAISYCPTPFLLGLKLDGEDFRPGKAISMKAAAVDPAGKTTPAGRLVVEISQLLGNWHTVYRNGRYVSLWDERAIARDRFPVESENGLASFQFVPDQYGHYLVRVSTADGQVVASRRVAAMGGDAPDPLGGSGRLDSLELAFDKDAYRIGDTARLSVKAPYTGTLLLGVERGRQLSSRVVAMEGPASVLEIPVTADMAPNATVTAWVIRPVRGEDKEWYAHRANGMISLNLSREPHRLKVSATAPDRVLPDKPLSLSFTVTDETGEPVRGEFSAAFIDEGVLSLTAFTTPDPLDFFMARRRAVGSSHDVYDALLRPEARATPLLRPGGDAARHYQGSLGTQQVFLTAYQPLVHTDANGRGEVRFELPEYSGKGRLMIVGASGSRFASAETRVRVARDLVLEASAPRAVAPGDSFELSIDLFTLAGENSPALQGAAEVEVTARGPLALSGELKSILPLESAPAAEGQKPLSHRLNIRAEALQESGLGVITASVSVPGRADLDFSRSVEVAVRPPFPRTGAASSALIRAGENAVLSVPGKWLKGSAKTSFSIDRSPALAVLPALEFLREYPYGCLEQTTSRAWPYLALAPMWKLLYPEGDEAALANTVKSELDGIVARIASMQTPEGGFGLWPGRDVPDPWKSVNAAFFLVEAKAGTAVPRSTLDGALAYLRLLLAARPREGSEAYDYSVKAYAAFVLTRAGEPPLSWIQHLSGLENKMYPSGRIFLAGAKALKAGNPEALKALEAAGGGLTDRPGPALGESMESALRNRSLRLLMWSLVAPGDARSAGLCADLARELAAKKHFSTQEAGMAALAIGRYLEKTGLGGKPYTARISSAETPLASVTDGSRLVLGGRSLPLDAEGRPPALSVAVGSASEAYAVYSVRGVPLEAPKPESSGLNLRRVWRTAERPLDLSSGPVRVKRGERIIVELSLTPDSPLSHVALSDLLPGGMELENPRLNTAAGAAGDGDDSGGAGTGIALDAREDRILLFFDSLRRERVYSYSMRAVSRGVFALPPPAADAMYDPEVRAVGSSGTVIVE